MKLTTIARLKIPEYSWLHGAISDRQVFLGDSYRELWGICLQTGDVMWRKADGFQPWNVAGDCVIAWDYRGGRLRGLAASDGRDLWTLRGQPCCLWREGLVVLDESEEAQAGNPLSCRLVDVGSGQTLQTFALPDKLQLLSDAAGVIVDRGTAVGYDLAARQERWRVQLPPHLTEGGDGAPWVLATYHPPDTLVLRRGEHMAGFSFATGQTAWCQTLPPLAATLGWARGVFPNTITLLMQESLYAINAHTGAVRWAKPRTECGDTLHIPPALFQNSLVVIPQEGPLLLVNESNGAIEGSIKDCKTVYDALSHRSMLVTVAGRGRVKILKAAGV